MWTIVLVTAGVLLVPLWAYLALLAAVYVIHWLADIKRCNFPDLKTHLGRLLESGFDGAELSVSHADASGIWIRFRKYIRVKGDYGLELCFPIKASAESQTEAFREYCDSHRIRLRTRHDQARKPARVMLCADFARDIEDAYALLSAVIEQVLKLPLDETYYYSFRQMARDGVLIDDPGWHSSEKLYRVQNEQVRAITGESLMRLGGTGMLVLLGILGTGGLVFSLTSLAHGPGLLSFTVFGVRVHPRVFDLFCIGLIALSYSAVLKKSFWLMVQSDLAREMGMPVEQPRGSSLLLRLSAHPLSWVHALTVVLTIRSWIEM